MLNKRSLHRIDDPQRLHDCLKRQGRVGPCTRREGVPPEKPTLERDARAAGARITAALRATTAPMVRATAAPPTAAAAAAAVTAAAVRGFLGLRVRAGVRSLER